MRLLRTDIYENLRMALDTLWQHKLRSLLTILGMVVGTTTVIVIAAFVSGIDEHVYFPVTSVISLLTDLQDGSGVEVGLVGREGMAGISVILGSRENKVGTVQHAGTALRVKAGVITEEFNRGLGLRRLLMRYMSALISQISQSVVCNVRHKVEERFIRWLLMHSDRIGADEFTLTQEFIANMLGVRRPGITVAAHNLQQEGLIDYTRGHIRILNRKRLEERVCECYHAVKPEFDDLYG